MRKLQPPNRQSGNAHKIIPDIFEAQMFTRLSLNIPLTQDEMNRLFHAICVSSSSRDAVFEKYGWRFTFRQFFNRYVVFYKDGTIREVYAPNDMAIMTTPYTSLGVKEIVLLHNPYKLDT